MRNGIYVKSPHKIVKAFYIMDLAIQLLNLCSFAYFVGRVE